MAFDGIVVADLVHELRKELLNGRIARIVQPEPVSGRRRDRNGS